MRAGSGDLGGARANAVALATGTQACSALAVSARELVPASNQHLLEARVYSPSPSQRSPSFGLNQSKRSHFPSGDQTG